MWRCCRSGLFELIGSIRREWLDHNVVLGEAQLRGFAVACTAYYNECRTHPSPDKDFRAIGRSNASASLLLGRPSADFTINILGFDFQQ